MPIKLTSFEDIKDRIYTIRGQKVMLDRDLAVMYGVTTGNLNKAVKRNLSRFPIDFMFQLTKEELRHWVFQNGIANSDKMGLRIPPHAFTELGVAMLSSVLKSHVAIDVNIRIMRAFVELRQVISTPATISVDYDLIKERMSVLETRLDVIQANLLVENVLMEKKLSSLSSDVRRVSQALDAFQDGYVVIKRPEEGATFD